MRNTMKKIRKADFEKVKEMISKQREACIELLNSALDVVYEKTESTMIWFGEFSDSPLAKEGFTVDELTLVNDVPWISMSGEYQNDSIAVGDMEIEYLIGLAEFVRDNIDDIIETMEDQ